jgi:hypothetical protein
MEYGQKICQLNFKPIVDDGYIKHIGWEGTIKGDVNYQFLFEPSRMLTYQKKITELLEGVSPDGRPIQVPISTIGHILSQCYESNSPIVGDIYSRYIQPSITDNRNDVSTIVDRAINIIVSQIRNEYGMIANNKKLTVWNTLYGDFNKEGLRSHAPLKMRRGGPERFQFNMNY